jgi:chorismate mutase/prephenate dehydratase
MTDNKTLGNLRHEIDSLDDRLLEMLNQRAALVMQVGSLKTRENREFHVPSREREIYERLAAA